MDLTAALSAGLRATHEVGSATACLLSLDRSGVLHALNLGDSGFRVLSSWGTLPAQVKARSTEQTHGFNFITLRPENGMWLEFRERSIYK